MIARVFKMDAYGVMTSEVDFEAKVLGFVGLVNQPYAIVRVGNKLQAKKLEELEIHDAGMERTDGASGDTGTDGPVSSQAKQSKARVRRG